MSNLTQYRIPSSERKIPTSIDDSLQVSPGIKTFVESIHPDTFTVLDAGSGLLQDNFDIKSVYNDFEKDEFILELLTDEIGIPRTGMHTKPKYHSYSTSNTDHRSGATVDQKFRELQYVLSYQKFEYDGTVYDPEWMVYEIPQYPLYRFEVDTGQLYSLLCQSNSYQEYDELVTCIIKTFSQTVKKFEQGGIPLATSKQIFTF